MNELESRIVEYALDIIKINALLRIIGHGIGGLLYFLGRSYKAPEVNWNCFNDQICSTEEYVQLF